MSHWSAWCLIILAGLAPWLPGRAAADTVPPPAAVPAQHAPAIQIRDATYGATRTSLVCAAVEAVKRQCEGKVRCTVPVADDVCTPPQRAPAVLIAGLSVRYHCFQGDKDRVVSADRPFQLRISCSLIAR